MSPHRRCWARFAALVMLCLSSGVMLVNCGKPTPTSQTTPTFTPTIPISPIPTVASTSTPEVVFPSKPVTPTAVLFLVDESGGVSGGAREYCPQDPVVDQEGLRWDLVRFYIALWQAWYDSANRWPLSGSANEEWPSLKVGIAAFARDYNSILPLTDISELNQSGPWEGIRMTSASPVNPQDPTWFCNTAYQEALSKAMEELKQQNDVSQRILILLTDGSFEGVLPADQRDNIRRGVEKKLKELDDNGIQVWVLLFGEDRCRQENDPDCHLSSDKISARNVDLDIWQKWQVRLQDLPRDHTPRDLFVALSEHFQTISLFPIPGVWVDGRGQSYLNFLGRGEKIACIIVTAKPAEWGTLHLRGEEGEEIGLFPQSKKSLWFRGEKSVTSILPGGCPYRQWTLEVTEDVIVYAWLVTLARQVDVASLEVSPDPIVFGQTEYVTVTTRLTALPEPSSCYSLSLNIGRQSCFPSEVSAHNTTQCPLPPLPKWGLIPVTTQVIYKDEPEKSPLPKERYLQVVTQPKIEINVISTTETVTVTIHVPNASDIPNLSIHISLYPEQFDENPPLVRPNCASTTPEEAEKIAMLLREGPPYWVWNIPYENVLNSSCDYHWLRIRWEGGRGTEDRYEYVIWRDLCRGDTP